MGAGFSQVLKCFDQGNSASYSEPDTICNEDAPVEENLGHSFCYVRSSGRFLSPANSDRFVSPSQSFRFDDPGQQKPTSKSLVQDTGFRAISGASVSANSSTPITMLQDVDSYDDISEGPNHLSSTSGNTRGFPSGISKFSGNNIMLDGFESTSSFSALPLQRLPRGSEVSAGPQERTFFMSGPIERLAVSGPLDGACTGDAGGGVPFSAPLGDIASKKRRKKKGLSRIRKTLSRNFSVAPVRNLVNRPGKDIPPVMDKCKQALDIGCEGNVQWALGKAGEDRVHVVVSEELGWLFVGIYDGFNGPDAPEFLMSHLYKAMFRELEGLFWANADAGIASDVTNAAQNSCPLESKEECESQTIKKVMFGGQEMEIRRRRLWEFLVDDHPEDGLDLSGSQRFSFTVDDALSVNNAGSAVNRRSLLLSKLKHGLLNRHKDKDTRRMFPWKFWSEVKHKTTDENRDSCIADDLEMGREKTNGIDRKKKLDVVDHELVLRAMARALDETEQAYLELTDSVIDRYPELALMGSCLLVVLMRDEDVYVMNLGDSRAIVAQLAPERVTSSTSESVVTGIKGGQISEGIVEEGGIVRRDKSVIEAHSHHSMRLTALQLSTDHSTSIKEEILRIKNEHPDDENCIVNGRVKGRLKVTRAFGAGFLKQRKWNDSLLEMFRNDYIGTAPYLSCIPSLHHHKLCPRDQFLVLSSDGLYQYFSNQEVISHIRHCMEKFPDGDPAQSLIEELLSRAARKAGMDFHDLLDIPQGDRRKYHDDVTVMVVSLEGRIWKSSGKYV